jgi:hypothetical protein
MYQSEENGFKIFASDEKITIYWGEWIYHIFYYYSIDGISLEDYYVDSNLDIIDTIRVEAHGEEYDLPSDILNQLSIKIEDIIFDIKQLLDNRAIECALNSRFEAAMQDINFWSSKL